MKAAKVVGLHYESDEESFGFRRQSIESFRVGPISEYSGWHRTAPETGTAPVARRGFGDRLKAHGGRIVSSQGITEPIAMPLLYDTIRRGAIMARLPHRGFGSQPLFGLRIPGAARM